MIRGRAISANFNNTPDSNCPAYLAAVERRYVIERRRREECRRAVARGHWSGGLWAAGLVVGARCIINPTDSKARFPALSKLSTGRRTLTSDDVVVDVRRHTQGWCKQRIVQNMRLIWRMSYHATNSSHVTDHLLSTLLSLRYMCCIVCCWKSHLTPAVLYWKAPAASVSLSRQDAATPPAAPCVSTRMWAHFMVRLYIAVVCKWQPTLLSYGEALAYRIAIFCVISYRIYRFLLWLYRAITTNFDQYVCYATLQF